ncbi:TetR family transcriptional regulator [Nocardia vaccinii]|uniref:TetR family transcriptional regulator n=1 Tax=Nocardia vaccinii TaxID=1822 RepID=UPI0008328B44|nr:TetR family transcriptional regulator [Nocardia vaccinii]
MSTTQFHRARSPEAKREREIAIIDAARRLATERGVRAVTLTDIAGEVGMHKSAMLRYFETREQIFLQLNVEALREWSAAMRSQLEVLPAWRESDPDVNGRCEAIAAIIAASLVSRPLLCDLTAHTPLNLERNVSLESVRSFKLVALEELSSISDAVRELLPLDPTQVANVLTTATSMAGALWQMAALGTELRRLYESDPALSHAVVDAGPQLSHILAGLLRGYALAR